MKQSSIGWLLGLVMMCGAPVRSWAVNGDTNAPCWRPQAGTTRQTWRFDSGSSPAAPEVVSNPLGARAVIAPNANGVGWIDSTCALYSFGCDPMNGDPDPFGTAQGYWDLGGTNASAPLPGTVTLTVSNTISAGATRYLWLQVTVWIESGIAAYPSYVVSNAVQVGSAVNMAAENPTNYDGSPTSGLWWNQQTLWVVAATGNFDTIQLRAAGVGTIVDTVTVDTVLRTAGAEDLASTPANTATNLSGATLVANDGGPTLSVVGASTPTAAGGTNSVGGGNVTYTPPTDYTGPDTFYYTNSDCAGGLAVGQVTVTVTGSGPVANNDTITRGSGIPLHITTANLLGNDTGSALVFAGLNLVSTNGVTVSTNATTIFYTNTNNVNDRLTYYIRDNANARAGGYLLIQVTNGVSNSVIVQLQTGVPGPNTNTVTLAGIPNYQYVLQFATNVSEASWFNLSTNAAGSNGQWTVLDPTATNAQRYYRVSTP